MNVWMLSSYYLGLIFVIIKLSNGSILEISNTTYEIQTPPFALGNLDFPIIGNNNVVFCSGCSGINGLSSDTLPQNQSSNSNKFIVFVEYNAKDDSCLALQHVLKCQKKDWCLGVVLEDPFFNPTGYNIYSAFDKHRPREEYRVPLVQVQTEDFRVFEKLIRITVENKQQYKITLTHDENQWEKMFKSTAFLIGFQNLLPLTSFMTLILIGFIMKKKIFYDNKKSFFRRINLSLKHVCLGLNAITHISRIILSVDPFQSQQIYPYLVSVSLATCSVAFEISSSILLAFVIRELTQATKSINMMTQIKWAYTTISLFLILSFTITTLEGLKLNLTPFRLFYVVGGFYVLVNVFLGSWYFWQGHQFLKMSIHAERAFKKQNKARVSLTRLSMFNSIGMILFGLLFMMMAIRGVYGKPWGYYSFYGLLLTVSQTISIFEVFLFGGVRLNGKRMTYHLRALSRRSENQNHNGTIEF